MCLLCFFVGVGRGRRGVEGVREGRRGGMRGLDGCVCVVGVDRLGFIAAGAVFVLVQYFEYKVGYLQ